MRRTVLAFMTAVALAFAVQAGATTITFDDLATPNNDGGQHWASMPGSYGGLVWTDWEVARESDFRSVYANTGASPSPVNIAYNRNGLSVAKISDGAFFFDGASVRSWGQNNSFQWFSARSITVEGWRNGVLVGSTSTALSAAAWVTLEGITSEVDTLVWKNGSTDGHWFAMDDLNYSVPAPVSGSAVPDGGATLALIGGALMGLGALRRKFRG